MKNLIPYLSAIIAVVLLAAALAATGGLADALLWLALLSSAAGIAFLAGRARSVQRVRAETLAEMRALLAEREQVLSQRVEELSVLHRISLAASSGTGVDEVLRNATDAMQQNLPYSHLAIFLVDKTGEGLTVPAGYGPGFDKNNLARIRVGEGITGYVAATGQSVMVPDVSQDSRYIKGIECTRSELCVPMKVGDRIIGGINVESPNLNAFTQDDERFLTTIASQLGLLLENARLLDETRQAMAEAQRAQADLQRRVEELTTLHHVSMRLVSSLDLQTVLRAVAESTLRLVEATDVHIFLYDEARQTLTPGTVLWASGETSAPIAEPRPNGITMTAIRERRPVVIQDARTHPLFAEAQAKTWGVEAIASFPLLRGETAIGALNVAFLKPHAFSDDELRVLTLLADQAAIAVENARLHAALADQATRDSLTQLYNHGHLLKRLSEEVQRAQEQQKTLSFIMLDIDGFKQYNDTYGHVVGDRVLCSIASAMTRNIKRTDIVGRWGGEEFCVVLPGANAAQATKVAQRIAESIAALDLRNGKGEPIAAPTVSQGVATYPDHADSAVELVDVADRCLLRAKARGRARIVVAKRRRSGGNP